MAKKEFSNECGLSACLSALTGTDRRNAQVERLRSLLLPMPAPRCVAAGREAIARIISLALRSGVEPKAIIKHLRGIACHSIAWHEGEKILSCADAIAKALEIHRSVILDDNE